MWNMPFIIVPLLLSSLKVDKLPIVYVISALLLLPFIFLIYTYIQEPEQPKGKEEIPSKTVLQRIMHFWSDQLNRKSFITQSLLHLYYAITGVFLPIYLYSYFGFDWDKIGLMLLISSTPFILFQIPFGKLEDKQHNEKKIFIWGIIITIAFTILGLLVKPNMPLSFLLLALTLFLSKIGCSLIEIAMEGMFYKHVSERNAFALMSFRAGRLFPYVLGLLAVFWL
jgi:MFS family permease